MTKDDIIRMAWEAGLGFAKGTGWGTHAGTQRFANLVAAAAAAAEREACAKLCEQLAMQQEVDVRDECAAAIRARGNT